MAGRMSMYSVMSEGMGGSRGPGQPAAQVSTTTLLNAAHNIYLSSQPYCLDAGASLVVNTWLTASQVGPDGRVGGTVDASLGLRAWEHARRRAEDGCVILGSLHKSTPSVMRPFLSSLPFTVSPKLFAAIDAIEPFLRCVTPYNPSAHRQTALAVTLTLNLAGNLTSASLALASGGLDTDKGLLNVPAEAGYRAFDVFYYLLTSVSTPAEREFLSLKPPSHYRLLSPSGTYEPPSYLPTADDGAAADDFRSALKEIGIKGSAHRNLITVLAGLLKLGDTVDYHVDEDVLDEVCEDVGGLLGIEPEVLARKLPTEDRRVLLAGLYEALVDWVISRANSAISSSMGHRHDGDDSSSAEAASRTGPGTEDNSDTVCLHVIEIPDMELGKAVAMRGIFDDSQGINAEMKQDGIDVAPVNSSVLRDVQTAVAECGPELGIMIGTKGRERQHAWDKREEVLEKVGLEAEEGGFLRKLLFPVPAEGINLGRARRVDIPSLMSSSRLWYHLSVHPTDDSPASLAALPSVTSAWSAGTVSRQLRAWRLPEWANRRNKHLDYTADFDLDEFAQRYGPLGCSDGREGINNWILERGWTNGEVVVGHDRVWIRENAWREAEGMLDVRPTMGDGGMGGDGMGGGPGGMLDPQAQQLSTPMRSAGLATTYSNTGSGFFPPTPYGNSSSDQLMPPPHQRNASQATFHPSPPVGGAPSIAQSVIAPMRVAGAGDYGLGHKGDDHRDKLWFNAEGQTIGLDPDLVAGKHLEERPISYSRRFWVAFVWALTFWIPSPLLSFIGRMRRPDVRMAWREKLVLCFLIILANGIIIFWIVKFGRLLCPNYDKAWDQNEVSTHQGDDDFWVSIHGGVYDISKFWKRDHSDVPQAIADSNAMQPFAGMNLDEYFVPPLPLACPGLGIENFTMLQPNNTPAISSAEHYSGHFALYSNSALGSFTWYTDVYEPAIKEFYHGQLVWDSGKIASEGDNEGHMWFIYNGRVYDMTDYFYTKDLFKGADQYVFLDDDIVTAVSKNPGTDLTETLNSILSDSRSNSTKRALAADSMSCIKNLFFVGVPDFRNSARCQVNNYILLAFMILLCLVILVKFLAALQFGSKRRPAPQDKFVICQVPAYTEGEDSLRKALDSLTALQYDNKRKLICVICDGVVTGAGNDRPTAKIVLDILGVDPKVDPPALPFKSIGNGAEQLNYGKVFSGLYEYEGNVVPYLVVVKCGKDSEQTKSKPGNRGKRDSQIVLMSFLNRVHHRAPMNALELEMFHQINNVIGVDPELYEYLLMVDADTCVREDSLNRLVAKCANDAKIAGICGETSLQNEERSWWTMIQVYEYFISHHLAKAFESLFGSVTCLPGCFSMYRLRTADRGKPLIISDDIIREYSDCNVDTLHKKNLLSLGEDRYLTTLMTKHFPFMSYKFIPDAYCQTAAPEKWSVLLSQRRRWINSTIHNLVELIWVKEMCGFCCFSMRFVVFIDLAGTILLPATTVYLVYLIVLAATGTSQFPIISIIMLGVVYGLQALIFILKRQWQHIGWMIIYLLAFPIYSFILPLYSFWNQDNFSWGNTRIVVGETGKKQVLAVDDEGFDPRSIPLQRWDDYATANSLPGRRGAYTEKMDGYGGSTGVEDAYEMDDIKSVYSSVRQASILTGLQGHNGARNTYMPPQSPGTPMFGQAVAANRASTFHGQGQVPYSDNPLAHRQSFMSLGGDQRAQSPFGDNAAVQRGTGTGNLRSVGGLSMLNPGRSPATTPGAGGARGGTPQMRASSALSMDYQRGDPLASGPDDMAVVEAIQAVLRDVDLDTVTKKQVRALVEQRLQTELVGERRTFMDRQIDTELASM